MRQVKLNLSGLGKIKMGIHTLQGILLFVAICIFIAMSSQEGKTDGRAIYYIIAAVFTIPALIYLAVVPLWERSQRFCNTYAFLAVDAVFGIFWLAAWAAMVSWVRQGMQEGAQEKKIEGGKHNCTTFDPKAFGTEKKCHLANDCVGMGVSVFVLFIPTTVISYLYLRKTMKEPGTEPWLGKDRAAYANPDTEAGKDSAWSTDMHDNEDTGYPSQHNQPQDHDDDQYQLLHGAAAHGTDTEDGRHPGTRWGDNDHNSTGRHNGGRYAAHDDDEEDTGYHGPGRYDAPSALSPVGYEPARGEYPGRGRQDHNDGYPPSYSTYDR